MSGLSSGTYSWGGDAGRCLGGGDGDRLLKKLRRVPFFLLFFLDVAFGALVGAVSTGNSSSVGGADDSAESDSESLMFAVVVGCDGGCGAATSGRRNVRARRNPRMR